MGANLANFRKECCWQPLSCQGPSLTKNKYVYNISLAEMLCTMLHASY